MLETAAVAVDGKWWFINTFGAWWVIAPRFERAWYFSESRASVQLKGRGYVDLNGINSIRRGHVYELTGEFSHGLADVARDGQYGFVNSIGTEVIPLTFQDAREFSEGFAGVKHGGKWGYIDMMCSWVITPRFIDPVSGVSAAG